MWRAPRGRNGRVLCGSIRAVVGAHGRASVLAVQGRAPGAERSAGGRTCGVASTCVWRGFQIRRKVLNAARAASIIRLAPGPTLRSFTAQRGRPSVRRARARRRALGRGGDHPHYGVASARVWRGLQNGGSAQRARAASIVSLCGCRMSLPRSGAPSARRAPTGRRALGRGEARAVAAGSVRRGVASIAPCKCAHSMRGSCAPPPKCGWLFRPTV
jgi:hypothetical protein